MIQIRRVLCPIDFSEFSRRALRHAVAVSNWYGAQLTVLHVFANLPSMDLPPLPLGDADRERLMTQMREFAGSAPPDLPVTYMVKDASDARHEILSTAEALMSDLIVIGSHGRSGFERLLLGSVTEKIVRKAPCPVMVVPHAPGGGSGALIEGGRPRILCAVDFSDASLRALEYAISIAEESDADLTVLHSLEVPAELLEPIPVPADFDVDRCHATARAACLERLRGLVPASVRPYCHVETDVQEGAAYRRILRVAADRHADLIVMGVHGRGALDVLVFGSNTARVIRAATCPVLVVPGR